MSVHENFLRRVERYLKKTGTSQWKFGLQAMHDPKFVSGLRKGRSPGARTIDRVDEFIKHNPDGLSVSQVAQPSAA